MRCAHENTYYDEKGERCRDCHAYLPAKQKKGDKQ